MRAYCVLIGAILAAITAAAVLLARSSDRPLRLRPAGDPAHLAPGKQPCPPIVLSADGPTRALTTGAATFDTSQVQFVPQLLAPHDGPIVDVEAVLEGFEDDEGDGEHAHRIPEGERHALALGDSNSQSSLTAGSFFAGIQQTPWTPPDPTLAVGLGAVVETVNCSVAFYTRSGAPIWVNKLDSSGSPGLFEPAGAGSFTFDPKCLYDQGAGRFAIVALEVYGSNESWIDLAVSDDADPSGAWHVYRTPALFQIGNSLYGVDYPGFGYDGSAFYVTANLFDLATQAPGGVLFRVFPKSQVLQGAPATPIDLRDPSGWSVQAAHMEDGQGAPSAPLFVSVATTSSLRVQAITTPLSNPSLATTTVAIPAFTVTSGWAWNVTGKLNMTDSRLLNAYWRAGSLYTAHNVSVQESPTYSKNAARWYQIATGPWPASGTPLYVQGGTIDGGPSVHTFFPAIAANARGDVAVVLGMSSKTTRPDIRVCGRAAADPPGAISYPAQVKIGPLGSSGRWGDYFGIAVDPADNTKFWGVGEVGDVFGWSTWLGPFNVSCAADYDDSGYTDFDDFNAFMSDFIDGSDAADVDHSGFTDIMDFNVFVDAYESGC